MRTFVPEKISCSTGNHSRRIYETQYCPTVEHLYEAARAALGKDTPEAQALARQLKDHLWDGRVDEVIVTLQGHADRLGPPQVGDGPEHPRRVLANNVGYFTTHRRHMDYPTYRRKG